MILTSKVASIIWQFEEVERVDNKARGFLVFDKPSENL
jgi:hypothetical protein